MKTSQRITIITSVLVVAIGCDQLLKQIARSLLQFQLPISLLDDFVRLQYAENRGIMLSIGAALSPEVRFWIFTVVVGLLLIGMLVYAFLNRSLDRLQTVAWSLIVSGGLGNLIDRMFREGVVIDFVSIGFGVVRTAVFNLADVLVFAGVFLLLIHHGSGQEKPKGEHSEEPPQQSHE